MSKENPSQDTPSKDTTNYREHPERYRVGRGEQGVLTIEPYKSELLPHWRFKTPQEARASAETIFEKFAAYRDAGDFVGMDMARKFLQMGYTRSRRYAKYPSGRKYDPDTGDVLAPAEDHDDPERNPKAKAAVIFQQFYQQAKDDPDYKTRKAQHQKQYG